MAAADGRSLGGLLDYRREEIGRQRRGGCELERLRVVRRGLTRAALTTGAVDRAALVNRHWEGGQGYRI